MNDSGTLPLVSVARHDAVINALDALEGEPASQLESRFFATISIDLQKCNSCGMCAMFCPTGALRRDVPEKRGDPLRYLEFSASECVNCGSCSDVCWKSALDLSCVVDTAELFDFEPRVFEPSAAQGAQNRFF